MKRRETRTAHVEDHFTPFAKNSWTSVSRQKNFFFFFLLNNRLEFVSTCFDNSQRRRSRSSANRAVSPHFLSVRNENSVTPSSSSTTMCHFQFPIHRRVRPSNNRSNRIFFASRRHLKRPRRWNKVFLVSFSLCSILCHRRSMFIVRLVLVDTHEIHRLPLIPVHLFPSLLLHMKKTDENLRRKNRRTSTKAAAAISQRQHLSTWIT